jgi:hypothetical protein
MAAVVRVAGPPDVIAFKRADPNDPGKNLSRVMRALDQFDTDRGGKPYLIRFFREIH